MMQDFSSRHAYDRSLRTVLLKKPLQPSQLRTKEEKGYYSKKYRNERFYNGPVL